MTHSIRLLAAGLAFTALATIPATGVAQCLIVGVKGSSKQKINLTRTYAACTSPDVATIGGLPACSGASPNSGMWAADSKKTKASIKVKSEKDGNVTLSLKIKGLLDSDLVSAATGTGALVLNAVATIDDPVEGLVTTEPFSISAPVTLDKGGAKATVTVNDMMTGAGFGSLGECWAMELTGVSLEDPAGDGILTGISPTFSERTGSFFGSRG